MSGPLVLVTGAAGFIGARLAERLIQEGEEVAACDAPGHFKARSEIAALFKACPPGQVVDREKLPAWLAGLRPGSVGAIFHMGACTDTTNYDEAYMERMNTACTRTLWGLAARLKAPFLYASSAAVYGDGARGYDDAIPPEAFSPLNPYGWSKQRFDAWALGEGQSERPPRWAGFRFFNVYGFAETHKGKMASVLRQAFTQIQERGRVRLFRSHRAGIADGRQKRDFILAEDLVDVLLHAWRRGLPDGIYNLGTGRARTFLDLVQAAFAAVGAEPRIDFIDMPPHIRERYQYFTEARMEKLRAAGYRRPFAPIDEGAARYWARQRPALVHG
ncbi:MAG: ADP-glyceromanno-heptose 6-epimerase [Candidatus Tectomicrobia bacterium]|nr:ADP-glyceromanno-heptose 6-epimerase [Candidatus Tectomicrobia bacterium]